LTTWSVRWRRTGERNVERESLLATLIVLLGGLALQLFAVWPGRIASDHASRQQERLQWLALWWPTTPAFTVAAWLCGWALSQPDPVPDHVGGLIFVATAPFTLVCARALLRAGWSLCRSHRVFGIATVGLFHPRIVVAPALASLLDDAALRAAVAHERAHLLHHDPLRIWLAQFVTDLQWPWAPAQRRFQHWLGSLEIARDDEARGGGIEGADLAAAVLGSLRYQQEISGASAGLIGRPEALPARIERLLRPLPAATVHPPLPLLTLAGGLGATLLGAVTLGVCCGEPLVRCLLALSS
jgi:hypothetical protein